MRMVMVTATGVPDNPVGAEEGTYFVGNMIRRQRQPATFEEKNPSALTVYRER